MALVRWINFPLVAKRNPPPASRQVSGGFARFGAWTVLSSPSPEHQLRDCRDGAEDSTGSKDEQAASGVLDDVERIFFGGLHGGVPLCVYRCSVMFSLADSGFG